MLTAETVTAATQTTVVTTTTTTTTAFPPLMVKAPQHLNDLDPKMYPLAASPTPQSIKKLFFDVEGRPTIFQEADDTLEAFEKVNSHLIAFMKRKEIGLISIYRFVAQASAEGFDKFSRLVVFSVSLRARIPDTTTG